MTMRLWLGGLVLAAVVALAPVTAFAQSGGGQGGFEIGDRLVPGSGDVAGFTEITWDDLIPPDWIPEDLFQGLFDDVDVDALEDYDPRAMEVMDRIRALWDAAPVVSDMDGRRVRIPGFVVPLEGDGKEIHEFLLVPYFGACIHVPPPPANQLIHVMPDEAVPAMWNMMPVWVSGVMSVIRQDTDMGIAGYQMQGMRVEAYEE